MVKLADANIEDGSSTYKNVGANAMAPFEMQTLIISLLVGTHEEAQ